MINTIHHSRKMVDEIDQKIIQLLANRQEEVARIGEIKKKGDLPVYDAKRELDIRTRRRKMAKKSGLDPFRVDIIFEQIINLSRDTQENLHTLDFSHIPKLRIGVMGGIASFSEEAALHFTQVHTIKGFELRYPVTAENLLKDLDQGRIDLAIFPIENSTGGLVTESIHAMASHPLEIQEIFQIDIRHCLHVLPGVKRSDITKIMSHPQALRQCQVFLRSQFPEAQLIEATDTAEGCRILEQSPEEKTIAVIASKRAGEWYHLETLEENIQDQKINFTRFIAARKFS